MGMFHTVAFCIVAARCHPAPGCRPGVAMVATQTMPGSQDEADEANKNIELGIADMELELMFH